MNVKGREVVLARYFLLMKDANSGSQLGRQGKA